MVWVILGILICSLLVYLLFIKLNIVINTEESEYYVQAKGLFKASILNDKEEVLKIHVSTLFIGFDFYPLKQIGKKKNKSIKKKTKKKRPFGIRKAIKVFKTFKIKNLIVNVDTGNCITNARMYPVFAALDHHLGHFKINFQGKNQLLLHMQNRPITIVKAIINK